MKTKRDNSSQHLARVAKLVIAIGLLESFSVNFSMMALFIWLTIEFLPQTSLNPAATSTIFMALAGLSIFLLTKRIGLTVDRFKPYRLFVSTQVMNLVLLPAMALLVMYAQPDHPFIVLVILLVLDLLISARSSTYDSAVNVFIAHRVEENVRTDYYMWDFRIGLIAVFTAPVAASYAAERSIYLALAIGAGFSLLSLLALVTKPYRALEHYEYGTRISWSIKHWLNGLFTRQKTPQPQPFQQQQSVEETTEGNPPHVSGLASLRYVKHIKIILLLMVIEALGNRARESFDVYFITDTLGRGVADLGMLTTVLSVGLAIGSFASGWARKVISWQLWPSAVYVGFGLCFAAKGLAASWWLVLLFTAGEGLCLGLNSGLFQAAKMKFTPPHLIGSTSSAFAAVFQGASTAGLALWAAYAWIGSQVSTDFMHTWGYRIAFIIGGLGIALAGLLSPKLYRHLNWRKT